MSTNNPLHSRILGPDPTRSFSSSDSITSRVSSITQSSMQPLPSFSFSTQQTSTYPNTPFSASGMNTSSQTRPFQTTSTFPTQITQTQTQGNISQNQRPNPTLTSMRPPSSSISTLPTQTSSYSSTLGSFSNSTFSTSRQNVGGINTFSRSNITDNTSSTTTPLSLSSLEIGPNTALQPSPRSSFLDTKPTPTVQQPNQTTFSLSRPSTLNSTQPSTFQKPPPSFTSNNPSFTPQTQANVNTESNSNHSNTNNINNINNPSYQNVASSNINTPSYSSTLLSQRYGILQPPSSLGSKPVNPTSSILPYKAPFQPNVCYFFGVWRRTAPQYFGAPPLSLNASSGSLHLDTYDADEGCVFKVEQVPEYPEYFYLEADDQKLCYVTDKLRMSEKIEHAALWRFEAHTPFRGGKDDISVKIFNREGLLLVSTCSTSTQPTSLTNGDVLLVTREESEQKDVKGAFLYNNAWEATPEIDDTDVDQWLKEYLDQDDENDLDLTPILGLPNLDAIFKKETLDAKK